MAIIVLLIWQPNVEARAKSQNRWSAEYGRHNGSLIHTDQGSQYMPAAQQQLLEDHKISCSMSAKGCCWDKAVVERSQAAAHHC
jgi:transposase InsO family protein